MATKSDFCTVKDVSTIDTYSASAKVELGGPMHSLSFANLSNTFSVYVNWGMSGVDDLIIPPSGKLVVDRIKQGWLNIRREAGAPGTVKVVINATSVAQIRAIG